MSMRVLRRTPGQARLCKEIARYEWESVVPCNSCSEHCLRRFSLRGLRRGVFAAFGRRRDQYAPVGEKSLPVR